MSCFDADGEGVFEALVAVGVVGEGDDLETAVVLGEKAEDVLGLVGREIVDNDDFEVGVVLLEEIDEVLAEPVAVVLGGAFGKVFPKRIKPDVLRSKRLAMPGRKVSNCFSVNLPCSARYARQRSLTEATELPSGCDSQPAGLFRRSRCSSSYTMDFTNVFLYFWKAVSKAAGFSWLAFFAQSAEGCEPVMIWNVSSEK